MSAASHKDIALHYFRKVDDAVWECNECKFRRKQIPGSGYNNLYTHITAKHTDYREKVLSSNLKLTFLASPRAVNIYGWMEWVVMNGLPFSFVENDYNKKYTSLNPISRPTLMKYLELVAEKVEQKITVLLPEKFGIIIDGWSDSSTSEYYLALYAIYPSSSNENNSTLLAFSPLIDTTDFTSEKQAEFNKWNLSVFNKSVSNLLFMIGDNCSTNFKIAQDIKLPFIGCASHRLNLAVKSYIEKEEHIVRKT